VETNMEDEDFLAAVEADNANVPVEEPTPEPPVEAVPEPEAAPAEPVQPEPASPFTPPVVEAKPDPGFVPITAMLDERERRQKIEAELAQLRASQPQQQPQKIPDMFEDPDGFQTYQAQVAQTATLNAKLDISEEMARDKFGDEAVDQARDWALQQSQTRPGFYQELMQQRNPYRYAVEQFRREQIASQVSLTDFEQFQAWKAAQAALQNPEPANPAEPIPPRTPPPRSLASAPSAGGVLTEVEQSDEEAFNEVIPKR
jgi:hypothetical protein